MPTDGFLTSTSPPHAPQCAALSTPALDPILTQSLLGSKLGRVNFRSSLEGLFLSGTGHPGELAKKSDTQAATGPSHCLGLGLGTRAPHPSPRALTVEEKEPLFKRLPGLGFPNFKPPSPALCLLCGLTQDDLWVMLSVLTSTCSC